MPAIPQAEVATRNIVQQRRGYVTSVSEYRPPPPGALRQLGKKSSDINDFSLWPEDSDISHTDVLSMKLNAFNQANKEIATNLRSWEPPATIFDDAHPPMDHFDDSASNASGSRHATTRNRSKYEPQLESLEELPPMSQGAKRTFWSGPHGAGRPVQSGAETRAASLMMAKELDAQPETAYGGSMMERNEEDTYHRSMLLDLAAEITALEQEMFHQRKAQLDWTEKRLAEALQPSSRPWTQQSDDNTGEDSEKIQDQRFLTLSKKMQDVAVDFQGGGICLCEALPKGVVCSTCKLQGKKASVPPEKVTPSKATPAKISQAPTSLDTTVSPKWTWAPSPGTATATILGNGGPKWHPPNLGLK